jgi:Pyruvate phosphate dikinase, AMP/ATP-binding domain
MTLPTPSADRVLSIFLALNQYPILAGRIRARMRRELFERGIITPDKFESEARQKSIESQTREGLIDPYAEESFEVWEIRLARVRDSLTDFYYAYNFPYESFEKIAREIIGEHGAPPDMVTFNPELAPQDMLFDQAEMIEKLPREKHHHLEARLQEIKVVLIRTMISDQLAYLNIARKWFTVDDLREIRRRKVGYGKIGGKSAGMMLAYRILSEVAPPEVRQAIQIPVSYFLASDLFYTFMAVNGLVHWADQKYKPEALMRTEFPQIVREFVDGDFPPDILDELRLILDEAGGQPLIVRSSSLLEDNFGTSFAGKYDSYFCPNQGTPDENLKALTEAIARVYASCLNPDALLYRHHKGLVDYDERVAVLIQFVQGQRSGRYFMPHGAGVAFSHNLYRWSPQIKREDGFLRLVWGLGTRAVDTVGDDHPRLVALSHPSLHPAAATKMIRQYSQRYIDLIDLEDNQFKTLPVRDVFEPRYPALRYIAQEDQGDYLAAISSSVVDSANLVVTFDGLLRRTPFAGHMRTMLGLLEKHYRSPVDTEFTVEVVDPQALQPEVRITLLQCRPQSAMEGEEAAVPADLPDADVILSTRRMVPRGAVNGIRYVLFVPPEGYFNLQSQTERNKLEREIGALNAALKGEPFICVGPGRWGTSTPNLGVHVAYGDIYNTRALVELSGSEVGTDPEPSFGTHFFQDLMEAHIYPLAVNLDDKDAVFNRSFFFDTPSCLEEWLPSTIWGDGKVLKLIKVGDFRPGHFINLVMDDDEGRAVAYLSNM